MQATAISSGQSSSAPASAVTFGGYPTLSADITLPNIGLQGQLRSDNASQWAIPGMAVWIPPFGNIEILGVAGDLVTYRNLTVPAGTILGSGAYLIPIGPASPPEEEIEAARRVVLFDLPIQVYYYNSGVIDSTSNRPLSDYATYKAKSTNENIYGIFRGNLSAAGTLAGSHYLYLNDVLACAVSAGANNSDQSAFGDIFIKLTTGTVKVRDLVNYKTACQTILELVGYAV